MKALVLEENGKLVYKDVPFPEKPGKEYYLIRVKYAGICGSDIGRAFNGRAYHYPLIMGHEFSGVIEESFRGARFKKGTAITAFPLIPCGKCKACLTGNYAQCINYDYIGSRRDGAFAEYLYMPEKNIFRIPDGVNIKHAALTEPAAVALNGIRKLKIKGGESAAVFGGGTVGNLAAQWLSILGCEKVIVIEIDEKKLELAKKMNLHTCNPAKYDPIKFIMDITEGEGVNFSIEACGLPITYRQAILSLANFGSVVFIGNLSGKLEFDENDISRILRKEIKIYGNWNSKIVSEGRDDWSTVLNYMDKKLKIDGLISHTFKLEDGLKAFKSIMDNTIYTNKVILKA